VSRHIREANPKLRSETLLNFSVAFGIGKCRPPELESPVMLHHDIMPALC